MCKEEIKIHEENLVRMERRLKNLEEEEKLGVVHSLTETAAMYGLRFMINQSKLYLRNAKV